MDMKTLQRLLAAVQVYDGAIDGIIGPKSLAGIRELTPGWSDSKRRQIAAGQTALQKLGYEVGAIDGYHGNMTTGALLAWENQASYNKPLDLSIPAPTPAEVMERTSTRHKATRGDLLTQSEAIRIYGTPGPVLQAKLVKVPSPFPFVVEWNVTQIRHHLWSHSLCAGRLGAALEDIFDHYGAAEIHRLGIDQFAGDYNHRKMRGGTSWSMHAFGIAWDFDSDRNGLTTPFAKAKFSGPDYVDFLDIMRNHGFINLGEAIGRDAMHFQAIAP